MSLMTRGRFAVIACGALLALAVQEPAQAKILSQWVQLGPDGTASVRAVSDGSCPDVVFDGTAVPMGERSDPAQSFGNVKPAQFPVRGCEAQVPAGAIAALLDGKPLPLPRPNPQRILVFGDTGCRILTGDPVQSCNDINAWPFPKIAALAAATRPDLVIHVGDYHYRESPCPSDASGCANSPSGYGWDAWNADFFAPAAPLLAAAPWVMVRGNHEDCSRAGEGWFRFLDREPFTPACRDLTGDFVARLGSFGIVVVDSGTAADPRGDASQMISTLRSQFETVLGKIPDEAWLVTHRPPNAIRAEGNRDTVENTVLQRALGDKLPASVRMTVSGHIHYFQAIDFGGARAPQLIVGTGGDDLVPVPPVGITGADLNGRPVVNTTVYSGFGYMVWDRVGAVWSGTLFDVNGKPLNRCRLADRSLTCGS